MGATHRGDLPTVDLAGLGLGRSGRRLAELAHHGVELWLAVVRRRHGEHPGGIRQHLERVGNCPGEHDAVARRADELVVAAAEDHLALEEDDEFVLVVVVVERRAEAPRSALNSTTLTALWSPRTFTVARWLRKWRCSPSSCRMRWGRMVWVVLVLVMAAS